MRLLRAVVWVAAFAALLAGCSGADDKVVNVYNWSDYIDPQVLKDFEKQYGIKVNYDVYDKNEVLETKLLTGNTGFDVVVPSAPVSRARDPRRRAREARQGRRHAGAHGHPPVCALRQLLALHR